MADFSRVSSCCDTNQQFVSVHNDQNILFLIRVFTTMTVAGGCSSPQPAAKAPQGSKFNNYWPLKIASDDKIQALSSKRKYKRRGSKTAAMLIAGCYGLPSAKDNTDSCSSEQQEELAASGPPIIAIPPLTTSLTTLRLNSTSDSLETCLSDTDQLPEHASEDKTARGDKTQRCPFC